MHLKTAEPVLNFQKRISDELMTIKVKGMPFRGGNSMCIPDTLKIVPDVHVYSA